MPRHYASTIQTLPAAPVLPATRLRPGLVPLCVVLFKLRIAFAITLAAQGGAMLAGSGWLALTDTLILAVAVMLASAGAGAFNHWYDRDIDAVMGRTRSRPFVNGTLTPSMRWPVVFAAMVAGGSSLAAWQFGYLSGLFVAAGALTYAVVYTLWLKRRTHWNIVIGGAAGSWAVLAGAAAAGQWLTAPVLLLTAVLFMWTPSHFWSLATALADDYRNASVPMLPVTRGRAVAVRWNVINTIGLSATAVALAVVVNAPLLWLGAIGGSAWLMWTTLKMIGDTSTVTCMTAFKASLIQLGLLLIGLFAAYAVP